MANSIGKCAKCHGNLKAKSWRSAVCEVCSEVVDFGAISGDVPTYSSDFASEIAVVGRSE